MSTPADSLDTRPRVVSLPMEFAESVIVGVDSAGSPVERHASDWFQGDGGWPAWRFYVPRDAAGREDFTSWRLVVSTPTGVSRVVKTFEVIRLAPGDSLQLGWTVHTWASIVIDEVHRCGDT